ncbi:hypothetical protein DY000_02009243 [Brassica cretica]|uniref:Uncharacterized protein n=1 Tax=Brassica cretica TaxID=69181 RepID=A0ABQ7CKW3_BRACR|nr:hypothetical protein DY000_02009243 [Brassica cretica]
MCIRKWCEMIFRRVIVKSLEDNSNECRGYSVWMGKGSWSRRRHMKEASRGCVMIIHEEADDWVCKA